MIHLHYLCPHCQSTRAVVSLKHHNSQDVHCADCRRSLGDLSEIRQEISRQAREDASARAKRVFRQVQRQGKPKLPLAR